MDELYMSVRTGANSVANILSSLLRKYLNSIKIVQFAPQEIIDTSYVKWRDNEHFCCKTQIK
jgi:hypothetical protein